MYFLVAYAPNGVRRFAVDRPEMLLGRGEECDVPLPFPGVGDEHARLRWEGGRVEIEDLGSRKGVVVNGRKIKQAPLETLDEIRLGSIALLLEDVLQEPEEALASPESAPRESIMTADRMHEHLARISQWVLADATGAVTLESLINTLLADFGGGVLFLFQGEAEVRGIKFVTATDAGWLAVGEELLTQSEPRVRESDEASRHEVHSFLGTLLGEEAWIAWRPITALGRSYLFCIALPAYRPDVWRPEPALATLGDQLILGLVHHVGHYEPLLFDRREDRELVLAAGLVAGESKVMRRVLDQLRDAIDTSAHVLLHGELGVGRRMLAESLHLSGSRRDGPFVVATCKGAKLNQIEADLFGAEIAGRRGPIERESKFQLADGGTLFLQDIEDLPLPLQDRLMRFLRSGEVTPAHGLRVHRVDVRLIAAASESLEPRVARDLFRIDLAHRLGQYVINVPALRHRREDLPLLIQASINRCCHQTGKRIPGITVKALEALAAYDYPGNLEELESLVRNLVSLCQEGQPINAAMLSEKIRLAALKPAEPEAETELDLENLVAETERAAIREALRRSEGNKSEAARLLKLSRNGLAMKMKRLGLS